MLGSEPRSGRVGSGAGAFDEPGHSDSVSLSRAPLTNARESVREALRQVELARGLARDAQAMLVVAQSAARGEASPSDLEQALSSYQRKVEAAVADGGVLLAGENVAVHAEPDAGALLIGGVDLRLKAFPSGEGVIQVSLHAKASDASTVDAAEVSLKRLQVVFARLNESAKALEGHDRVLSVAETAVGARTDLNADSARLMALQVRQGLESAPEVAIANAEPHAVLALFRA
jgi:hypothetical protein